ncbi:MAG: DUF433 domain-containing protein [Thermoanaerobaculia bacterium]|nr:DUF433 domain-containing protein [Thermoanaerobaculia bacterium]
MSYMERIEVNPAVLVGKPVISGTRLAVHFIVGLLASGWSETEVLENYPGITHEDVLACLTYAAAVLETERVSLVELSPRPRGRSKPCG